MDWRVCGFINIKAINVNNSRTIYHIAGWQIRGFLPFSKEISPKVNVIEVHEFKLTFYDVAV